MSEIARRMGLSSFFYDVQLLPARTEKDKDTGMELVRFELEAKVRY